MRIFYFRSNFLYCEIRSQDHSMMIMWLACAVAGFFCIGIMVTNNMGNTTEKVRVELAAVDAAGDYADYYGRAYHVKAEDGAEMVFPVNGVKIEWIEDDAGAWVEDPESAFPQLYICENDVHYHYSIK